MNELYVITFKESGEILTPESFKKYWPRYGMSGNYLSGWRPAKRVYYTLGKAKQGFNFIPAQIKPDVEISIFIKSATAIEGSMLQQQQQDAKTKKRNKMQAAQAKRRLEIAQENFNKAQEELQKLKS